MSNPKRKPRLDLEVCYSGFKVEELEYIGYSRTTEDQEDDFLDTFNGKLDDGSNSEDDETAAIGDCTDGSFAQSYRCSTPTIGRKHRGSFPQDEELSEFNDEYLRGFPANDSGLQTQCISEANSVASFFGDENILLGAGSLESLPGSGRLRRQPSMRKRIELDSEIHDPYSNIDDMDLSIEEEVSFQTVSTLGTLKRRLSLKVLRKNISTGLFGSYLQRAPEISSTGHSQLSGMSTGQQIPLIDNKPNGPVNLWFRKFRNRHFI